MKVIKRWRRRRPGVYAWRTDRHYDRTRREWGYVGESVNIGMRDLCHLGTCRHRAKVDVKQLGSGTTITRTVGGCTAKPWTDLRPRRHTVIRLPWWLGFKWVLRPLETLVILALAPRYNHAKNQWNPRRVPLSTQAAQRFERDHETSAYRRKVSLAQFGHRFIQVVGAMCILAGLVGAWITR